MGKIKLFVAIAAVCFTVSACIADGKRITVVDKKTGVSVAISEDELSVTGEIPINDTMSIIVTEDQE